MVRLNRTYYLLLNFTSKLFQNWVFRAKFQRIKQIPHNSPTQTTNSVKFALFVNLLYIMFQAPAPAENPAEFRAIRPHSPRITQNLHLLLTYLMFQTLALAENSQEFQRIMQISCSLPTYSVIHVLRRYLRPLLTIYFRIEFQDFKLMLNHV